MSPPCQEIGDIIIRRVCSDSKSYFVLLFLCGDDNAISNVLTRNGREVDADDEDGAIVNLEEPGCVVVNTHPPTSFDKTDFDLLVPMGSYHVAESIATVPSKFQFSCRECRLCRPPRHPSCHCLTRESTTGIQFLKCLN